ncbi:MAG: hypothetical protein EHM93_20240 [Bacteroidales bacterium]|nr:MAG: hypothetical protein EHM93_20240 [Bacteroidales bacterium]
MLKTFASSLKALNKLQILSIVLVVAGLVLVAHFGLSSFRSFQQMRYIHEQGLDLGAAEVDAIRPWMTVRFVAVAYAVPQEYIFAELDIPFDQRNSNDTLGNLNKKYNFGPPAAAGGELPFLDKIRQIITQYRANPVATGLEEDIRPWMTIRYIANSTGVPEEYIFQQVGLPATDNENKPLGLLEKEYHYGKQAIGEAIKKALAQYGGK